MSNGHGKPDDPVHITRLTHDGHRVYVRSGFTESPRRTITTSRAQAAVFTRERAEFLIARGRPDPRYKPQIEET